ncbi:MAG: aldolase/citrate lyase family protein [Betaproteobacteria bacterium]
MSTAADYGSRFRLTLVTNDPQRASLADEAGVNSIGVDLEKLGKLSRQEGHCTRLSDHSVDDLRTIGAILRRAKLFARINPVHDGTRREIEQAIECGARILMLPFFRSAREVDTFARMIDGRARVVALIETASAVVRLRSILNVPGLDEVMVGLNDMRLEMKVANHFEVLASPVADVVASEVHRAGLDFSIGGLARPEDKTLPIDPDLVIAQYPRLGATGAWISRSFFRDAPPGWALTEAVGELRARLSHWSAVPRVRLEEARDLLLESAARLAGASQPTVLPDLT